MHRIVSKELINIIGNEILGINKTLLTDKWTFCVLTVLFVHVVSIPSWVYLGVINFVINKFELTTANVWMVFNL
jgi:hypothetical protein